MNQRERGMIIRTIIGEAAGEPEEGQAAVAHVILNRAKESGKSPIAVVLAPNQFEPWQTRAGELARISPKSEQYKKIGTLVDSITNGEVADPTGGATHFLQEEIVRKRRGGTLPNWAQGDGIKIGNHTFYNPTTGLQRPANGLQAINAAIKEEPILASQFTTDEIFNSFGTRTTPAQAPTTSVDTIIDAYKRPAGTPPRMIGHHTEEQFVQSHLNPPAPVPTYPGEKIVQELSRPQEEVPAAASRITNEGQALMKQGYQEGGVGGVGKMLLGGAQWALSPLSALVEGFISNPIARLTGNKEAGERAGLIVPTGAAGKVATAMRPSTRALKEIVKDIPTEDLPRVLGRLESNKNVTLMDVAPVVQGNAAGLATDPRNARAMSHLSEFQRQRMGERAADTRGAFEETLGKTPNVAETVDQLKAAAVKTGKEVIEPVVARTGAVEVTPIVNWIDSQMPPAVLNRLKKGDEGGLANASEQTKRLWELRQRIRGDWADRDKMFMNAKEAHALESELRTKWGADPKTGFEAREVRRRLIDSIDEAVPLPDVPKDSTRMYVGENKLGHYYTSDLEKAREQGGTVRYVDVPTTELKQRFAGHEGTKNAVPSLKDTAVYDEALPLGGQYKRALKEYAGDKKTEEAFSKGFDVFSNPTNAAGAIENHPDFWKKWAADASKNELEAVKKGIMIGADTRISNMRRGIDIPEGGFTQERIAAIVGEKEAQKIVDHLNDWRDIARTNTLLRESSATALRTAGQERRKVRDVSKPMGLDQLALPAAVAGLSHMSGAHPFMSAAAGLGVPLARRGYNKFGQAQDIDVNRAYAQWASATGQKKQDLVEALRAELARREPSTKGEKLLNLIPPSILRIAPQ